MVKEKKAPSKKVVKKSSKVIVAPHVHEANRILEGIMLPQRVVTQIA